MQGPSCLDQERHEKAEALCAGRCAICLSTLFHRLSAFMDLHERHERLRCNQQLAGWQSITCAVSVCRCLWRAWSSRRRG